MTENAIRKSPDFFKCSTVYQIFLRTFTLDGTLRAAQRMLPHVAGLGVDIVYLCPVTLSDDDPRQDFWSNRQRKSELQNPQNPYRVKDYYAVDPEYGTDDDLKAFVAAAHSLGMRVLLDLVYYHCGPTAVFIEKHPDFVKRDGNGAVKLGEYHFPELNFESHGLREYLWQNMEYFVREFNVDGYRCDVSFAVPVDFWEEGRRRMEAIKPDVVMISESWHDAEKMQRAAFDVNYSDISRVLHDAVKGVHTAEKLRAAWEFEHQGAAAKARYLSGLDNHDIANDDYDARLEVAGRSRRVDAALVVAMMLGEIPFLYAGQEIADGRGHSLFSNRHYGKNKVIDWSNALTPEGQERMSLVRELIALRHHHHVLAEGQTIWIDHDHPESVIAFQQRTQEECVWVAANIGNSEVTVTLTGLPGKNQQTLTLPSGGYVIRPEKYSQISTSV